MARTRSESKKNCSVQQTKNHLNQKNQIKKPHVRITKEKCAPVSMRTRSKTTFEKSNLILIELRSKHSKDDDKKNKKTEKQKEADKQSVNSKKNGKQLIKAVEFKENDIILGRIRGYCFWPGKVSKIEFIPHIFPLQYHNTNKPREINFDFNFFSRF